MINYWERIKKGLSYKIRLNLGGYHIILPDKTINVWNCHSEWQRGLGICRGLIRQNLGRFRASRGRRLFGSQGRGNVILFEEGVKTGPG